jgi:shikimate kinase
VLVGLPGAGKTAAGRITARLLHTTFTDLDQVIVRDTGLTIPELFVARGEPAFRVLEQDAMARALAAPPEVIAPGGGWAAQDDSLERARPAALLVYLRVSPDVAAARLAEERDRPLLQGDPLGRLERLLGAREVFYHRADAEVDTDALTPTAVAEAVAGLARAHGGW